MVIPLKKMYSSRLYALVALLFLITCTSPSKRNKLTGEDEFSFVFMTDIHLQPERGAAIGFQWAIHEVNKRNPDFVLMGGDMLMDVLNQSYERADSLYGLYMELIQKFRMPVYHTMGNHEVYGWQRMEEGIEQHPEFGKAMYEKRLGPRYYSFDHEGWHFIILDAVYLRERGTYSGMIDEEQIAFIKRDLEKLDQHTPLAISVHFPFISSAFQLSMGPTAKIPPGLLIQNSREVLALFADHNLKLVLQGHLHYLEDIYVQNRVHFITGGAVSGLWWNNSPDSEPEEGFLVVHVKGDEFSTEYVDFGWTPPEDI
jgi:3',5'-cyclic AMP phosphodiesterase CpdA